jgi:hypothetical protein
LGTYVPSDGRTGSVTLITYQCDFARAAPVGAISGPDFNQTAHPPQSAETGHCLPNRLRRLQLA